VPRSESSFTMVGADGRSRTFTILSDITPDDLMRLGLKAYVAEVRFGEPYESPFSRGIRNALVLSRVTQRG